MEDYFLEKYGLMPADVYQGKIDSVKTAIHIELENEKRNSVGEKIFLLAFYRESVESGELLGIVITRSIGPLSALLKTHEKGINPGGDVRINEHENVAAEDYHFYADRLIEKEELDVLWQ